MSDRAARARTAGVLALCTWLPPGEAMADGQPPFRLDLGATFSRFEQQAKTEVGGAKGDVLVEAMEIGFLDALTYDVWGPLAAGLFVQADAGTRRAGRFAGFDAKQKTIVTGQVGGDYSELWIGPLVRAEWRGLFGELGWGAYGARSDDARDDLPSEEGDTSGALRTRPAIAWILGLGGVVPVSGTLGVALRLQYRVRYYDRRGGTALANDTVHGTQSFTTFAGIAWRFGRAGD